MSRFISDLRYYKICNASLPAGSVTFSMWLINKKQNVTHTTIQITVLIILIRYTFSPRDFLEQVYAIGCIYLVQFLSVDDSFVDNELFKIKIKWNTESVRSSNRTPLKYILSSDTREGMLKLCASKNVTPWQFPQAGHPWIPG